MDERLVNSFHKKYVKDESGCWLWIASFAGKGYGQIKIPGERKNMYAHRLSYQIHNGEDPGKKQVCHKCDNPKCVNPEHLFLGSSQDNHDDMKQKGRSTYGENNASCKLKEDDVIKIKKMLDAGVAQSRIAKAFSISQMQISRIKTGQRWAYLDVKT